MDGCAKLLRDHHVFSCLSGRGLTRLTANSTMVDYPKGASVVQEGNPCTHLYVVISGRCEASIGMPDGSKQILDLYAPGDIFGDRPILTRDHFWISVRVLSDCRILEIPAADVVDMLEKHSRLRAALDHHFRRELRYLRRDREPEKLGRLAVFFSLSDVGRGELITYSIAAELRRETGCSVLFMRLVPGDLPATLGAWSEQGGGVYDDWRNRGLIHKESSGLWEVSIGVDSDTDGSGALVSMLGYMSRRVRYLVVHVHPDVQQSVVYDALVQADLPYVLMNQSENSLYRCNLLVRALHGWPSGELTQILPMICLGAGERAHDYATLKAQLGTPIHGFIHGVPEPHAFQAGSIGANRVQAHIRQIAHEIGRCRVGLALSAGGAKGLAHIGVIQVLEENGIDVDMIAGTSMGALVGALWAYGVSGEEMEHIARRNESWVGMLRLIDPVLPPRQGFIHGTAILRIMRAAIGDAHFSDMCRQLRVLATNLQTLERVVLESGEVAPIIRASMAMPGIVKPVTLDGLCLIDGGVSDPIPVDVLVEAGVEHVIAVNTIPSPEEMRACKLVLDEHRAHHHRRHGLMRHLNHYVNYFARGNILDVWLKSMQGFETRLAEGACRQADVVLRPNSCDGRWHDFSNPRKYIELGRRAAQEHLDQLKEVAA